MFKVKNKSKVGNAKFLILYLTKSGIGNSCNDESCQTCFP